MEIERKYLLDAIPFQLDGYERAEIKQGYISGDPVIRIRQWNDRYILTVKTSDKTGLAVPFAREEFEVRLSKEEFDHLTPKIETAVIHKTRYMIPLKDGLTAELDVYYGELAGLLTVEVEFETIAAALAFEPPDWFGADVSAVRAYRNNQLSRFGLPKAGLTKS